MRFSTEQEEFWAGNFGDQYIARNAGKNLLCSNISLFSKIFSRTQKIGSIIEYGANIGLNLIACHILIPESKMTAIEINRKAFEELEKLPFVDPVHCSILEYEPICRWEFVLVKGLLIHLSPEHLRKVYECLYKSSSRYICLVEYYNPFPVNVTYRGYNGKLSKRDFAGELLDMYKDVELIDYGFTYHRDPNFPQDDNTWFLLEKKDSQKD